MVTVCLGRNNMANGLYAQIAQGVQPVQIENPLNQMAKFAALQSAQQEQQLNALKMQELQRGIAEETEMRNYLRGVSDLSSPEVRANLLKYGAKGAAASKVLSEQATAELGRQKTQTELVDAKLKQSRQLLEGVTTPDQYIQWHMANHADPILGPMLKARGITAESSQARINQALNQPGGFERLLNESRLGVEKFMEQNKPVFRERDVGGAVETIAVPGLGGPATVVPGSRAAKGLTPEQARAATMGPIPAGYRLTKEGTLELIAGGPTATDISPKEIQKREAKFPEATQAFKSFEQSTDSLIQDLQRLKNHPGLNSITGVVYGRTPSVTAAGREAQALYDKILARGGFQELQTMRQNSPTGGALGNVATQEGIWLRQAFGALDRTQEPESVRNEIDRLIGSLQGSKANVREAYDTTYAYKPQKNEPATATSRSSMPALNSQDQQALNWANSNPNDPRAAQIKQRLGVQ